MAIFPGAVATDTDLYIAANDKSTALTAGINSAVTSIPVVSTTGFPATGFISIDSEIIHYSAIADSTHFTADTRGADGTTAASHLNTTAVYHNVIAAHHNALKDEIKAIEEMLNAKLGTSSSAYTGNRAIASNVSGVLVVSSVTDTELGYLSGVTSAIQTQLGTKAPLASPTFTTGITVGGGITLNASGTISGTRNTLVLGGSAGFAGSITLYQDPNVLNTPQFNIKAPLASTGQVTLQPTAEAADRIYTIPAAGADASFVMTQGTQTIAGAKTFSALLTPSAGIKGVSTNTDATAGNVGEYIESLITTVTNSGNTGAYTSATSITLTAGDWDVSGLLEYMVNSATLTTLFDVEIGINTTNNSSTGLSQGVNYSYFQLPLASVGSSTIITLNIPNYRIKLTGSTVIYLQLYPGTFSAGHPQYVCRLSARRVQPGS